jgi:hypothetical protein
MRSIRKWRSWMRVFKRCIISSWTLDTGRWSRCRGLSKGSSRVSRASKLKTLLVKAERKLVAELMLELVVEQMVELVVEQMMEVVAVVTEKAEHAAACSKCKFPKLNVT